MRLNSPTTDLYACAVLPLAQDNIAVAVDTLVAVGSLVGVHMPVEEEGNLVVVHIPAVDILEVAFAVQPYLSLVVHVDQDLFQAFLLVFVQVTVLLLVAVQVVVLLLVVWMVV